MEGRRSDGRRHHIILGGYVSEDRLWQSGRTVKHLVAYVALVGLVDQPGRDGRLAIAFMLADAERRGRIVMAVVFHSPADSSSTWYKVINRLAATVRYVYTEDVERDESVSEGFF